MKVDVVNLIKHAATVAQAIELLKGTVRESRAVLARESPADLVEFDARVAAARRPAQEAADAGARENAEAAKVDESTSDD